MLNWIKYKSQIITEVTFIGLKIKCKCLFQISCHVQAEPVATVRWYKDTMLLEQTDKRRMETFSNKFVLLLSKMAQEGGSNFERRKNLNF